MKTIRTLLSALLLAASSAGLAISDEANSNATSSTQKSRQEILKEIEESRKGPVNNTVPADELGIHEDNEIAGVRGDFCNSWTGYVDGRLYVIVAGYEYRNPKAGIIWIAEGAQSGRTAKHFTPTETGPACVYSERGGILAIRSKAGEFDASDADGGFREHIVVAPGDTTYYFDLRREKFTSRQP